MHHNFAPPEVPQEITTYRKSMVYLWAICGPYMGNLWEHSFDLWKTYCTLSCVGTHMFCLYLENQWVIDPYFYHIWVTHGMKKLILHLNLPIDFPQLMDVLPPKNLFPYDSQMFPIDVPYMENIWDF